MSEPKRLTEEELAEIRRPLSNDPTMDSANLRGLYHAREQLLGHIAAQDAELVTTRNMLTRFGDWCDVCESPQIVMPDGEHWCGDYCEIIKELLEEKTNLEAELALSKEHVHSLQSGEPRDLMRGKLDGLTYRVEELEAQLARIGAITMGLIPEPEPTEGVEAKVWELAKRLTTIESICTGTFTGPEPNNSLARRVYQYVARLSDAEDSIDKLSDELAKRDEEIARLRGELDAACDVETSRKLSIPKKTSVHCPSCGGWHEYANICPNNGQVIDWSRYV